MKKPIQVKVKISKKELLNNAYIQGQIRVLNLVRNWLLLEFPKDGKKKLENLETYLKNYANKSKV